MTIGWYSHKYYDFLIQLRVFFLTVALLSSNKFTETTVCPFGLVPTTVCLAFCYSAIYVFVTELLLNAFSLKFHSKFQLFATSGQYC